MDNIDSSISEQDTEQLQVNPDYHQKPQKKPKLRYLLIAGVLVIIGILLGISYDKKAE